MSFPQKVIERTLRTSPALTGAYAKLTHDFNPLHLDADFAAKTVFGRPIIHGTMALNLLISAIEETIEGHFLLNDINIRFVSPAYVGDEISVFGDLVDPESGMYEVEAKNGAGSTIVRGTMKISLR